MFNKLQKAFPLVEEQDLSFIQALGVHFVYFDVQNLLYMYFFDVGMVFANFIVSLFFSVVLSRSPEVGREETPAARERRRERDIVQVRPLRQGVRDQQRARVPPGQAPQGPQHDGRRFVLLPPMRPQLPERRRVCQAPEDLARLQDAAQEVALSKV